MFEDKLATTEFQYDGVKGGTAWKTAQDNEGISNDLVVKACSAKMSEEQATSVTSPIWGFLSLCLSAGLTG